MAVELPVPLDAMTPDVGPADVRQSTFVVTSRLDEEMRPEDLSTDAVVEWFDLWMLNGERDEDGALSTQQLSSPRT